MIDHTSSCAVKKYFFKSKYAVTKHVSTVHHPFDQNFSVEKKQFLLEQ